MNQGVSLALAAAAIGIIATALLDVWSLARRVLSGVLPPDYALVGRWFGHLAKGRVRHDSIANAPPVHAEACIGWVLHYAIGVAFAFVLVWYAGIDWVRAPTLWQPMVVGVGSVVAPFLVLQPSMGLGVAASRAPKPWTARLRSLINHAVFGLALYTAGWAYSLFSRAD